MRAATPELSRAETADGLKAALTQAASTAVNTLGKPDGFLGNPEVRIPLPGKLEKAARKLRKLGMGKQTDALEMAMNRAAEAAVPEAKAMFVEAIRQMSVADAVSLLRGPDDAATQYFRGAMSEKLAAAFPAHRDPRHRERAAGQAIQGRGRQGELAGTGRREGRQPR